MLVGHMYHYSKPPQYDIINHCSESVAKFEVINYDNAQNNE